MPKTNDLFYLPAGPAELCFDKNEFMKKTFAVDDFLHEHRNSAPLESMRDDLGIYLKVLRSAMIELINEDYADFVNLSTNLVGLDQSIENIQNPLEQLKNDIFNIKLILIDNMTEIQECLNQKKLLRNYKKNLKSLGKVKNSMEKLEELLESQLNGDDIKPIVLERAALELIQLKFHIKFCSDYLNSEQTEKADKLHKRLLEKLRKYFLNALSSSSEILERCLRIYTTIDECHVAEQVFRDNIVGTYMDKKISESSLQNSSQGLAGIYNHILDFISLNMKDLLLLTHHTDKVKGFNFLLNSFWIEVEKRLESHMASIFAPGNPDAFYLKYKCTLDFLARLETILGHENAIKSFRQHSRSKSFQSRWNLPVYFQIRFQEIAGQLEITCDKPINDDIYNKNNLEFQLIPFEMALNSILKCWSDGIYIENLFQKFWKFTLQIISRINRWIGNSINILNNQNNTNINKILFYVTIYTNGIKFIGKFSNIMIIVNEKMPPDVRLHYALLEKCIEDSKHEFWIELTKIENHITNELVAKSIQNIRQVSDIPRLYRKTNRDVPSKYCGYLEQMLDPIKNFRNKYNNEIDKDKMKTILLNSFLKITVQYYTAVSDVITSVQKTEESLRRLKNLREKSTSHQTSSDRQIMSDDDKIRLQLQVDVIHWTSEIENCEIERNNIEKLIDLINLVEDVTKIKISDK